ncbi:MAG: substrate-binding domain-containing protein [Ignavibacteriales bacterium]|nr:substrate-binding domain-containing protein [Ignavibacteriales bacterium]
MKRTVVAIVVFLSTIFLFGSCAKKEEKKQGKVIGVSLLARAHIFYRDLEEGLKQEAAKEHYELIITSADFDLGKQIAQIEDFVTRKVDAIIVCPVDSKGIGPGIKKANEANIPVFTADIAAHEGNVVSHIASDNVAGGRLAGEYLGKILNGKGSVAIINHPMVTSVLDRVQGFKDALAKYPGITIVADVGGDGVRDKAMQVAADILQAHPKLDGIFGINDDSALGALDAARQFKRTNLVIIGYDATPPAVDAITKGSSLKADVIQYPTKIGITTIAKIKDHFAGVQVPKVVPVEVGIVDKDALVKNSTNTDK